MIGFVANRPGTIALMSGGASIASATTTTAIDVLTVTLWTVTINGVVAPVTGQNIITAATALVGIGALIVSIVKVRRRL